MCSGWLGPWWSDTINVIVAIATVAATGASAFAIFFSLDQAKKSRDMLRRERRRLHDLDTLEDLQKMFVEIPSWVHQNRRVRMHLSTLSSEVLGLIPRTVEWADADYEATLTRYAPLNPGVLSLNDFTSMVVDESKKSFWNVVLDELTTATTAIVDEEASGSRPSR